MGPNFFDLKLLTRLAHLLSFAISFLGKKRIFPQTMISFIRKKKTKSKKKEEKSAAKKGLHHFYVASQDTIEVKM